MGVALCGDIRDERRRSPWTVKESDTVMGITGKEMVAFALSGCRICPAQYDCAVFAIETEAAEGTYSMPIEQMLKLRRRGDAIAIIEVARRTKTPTQDHVASVLHLRRS